MAAPKSVVWLATLQIDQITAALKQIVTEFAQVKAAFGEAINIKIDTSQFDGLLGTLSAGFNGVIDNLERLHNGLIGTMAAGLNGVMDSTERVQTAIAKLSGTSSEKIAEGIASGAKKGVASAEQDLTRLDAQLSNTAKNAQVALSKLSREGASAVGNRFDVSPKGFTSEDQAGRKFQDPEKVGDVTRDISSVAAREKDARDAIVLKNKAIQAGVDLEKQLGIEIDKSNAKFVATGAGSEKEAKAEAAARAKVTAEIEKSNAKFVNAGPGSVEEANAEAAALKKLNAEIDRSNAAFLKAGDTGVMASEKTQKQINQELAERIKLNKEVDKSNAKFVATGPGSVEEANAEAAARNKQQKEENEGRAVTRAVIDKIHATAMADIEAEEAARAKQEKEENEGRAVTRAVIDKIHATAMADIAAETAARAKRDKEIDKSNARFVATGPGSVEEANAEAVAQRRLNAEIDKSNAAFLKAGDTGVMASEKTQKQINQELAERIKLTLQQNTQSADLDRNLAKDNALLRQSEKEYQALIAAVDKLIAAEKRLGGSAEAAQGIRAGIVAGGSQALIGPGQNYGQANVRDEINTSAVLAKRQEIAALGEAQAARARASAKADNTTIASLHDSIGLKMLGSLVTLGKLLVVYRLLRDSVREIESLVSKFIGLGIAYQKQQEDNQANLQGVLAANFKVLDAQGAELQGAERLNAIRVRAGSLAKDIFEAASRTSTKTEDMVTAYESLTEPLTRYKQNTAQILDTTVLTASAAHAAGLSAKEAATQIGAMLEGKAPGKLGRSLGITKEDVDRLAGTPKLLELIQARLKELGTANEDTSGSLSNVIDRFTNLIGKLSAGIEAPFFVAFKQFVSSATAFLNSEDGKHLFALLSGAGSGISSALRESGANILGSVDGGGLATMVAGVEHAVETIIKFGEVLIRATIAITQFVASNRTLIEAFLALGVVYTAYLAIDNFGIRLLKLADGTGIVGKAITALYAMFGKTTAVQAATVAADGLAVAQTGVATTAVVATTATTAFLRTLAVTSVIGIAIAALALLVSKVMDLVEQWRLAKTAHEQYLAGDFTGSSFSAEQLYNKATTNEDQNLGGPVTIPGRTSARNMQFDAAVALDGKLRELRANSVKWFNLNKIEIVPTGDAAADDILRLKVKIDQLTESLKKMATPTSEEGLAMRKLLSDAKDTLGQITPLPGKIDDATRAHARLSANYKQVNATAKQTAPKGAQFVDLDMFGRDMHASERDALVAAANKKIVETDTETERQTTVMLGIRAKNEKTEAGIEQQRDLAPKKPDPLKGVKEPLTKPKFVDNTDIEIKVAEEESKHQQRLDEEVVAHRDMLESTLAQNNIDRAIALSKLETKLLEAKQEAIFQAEDEENAREDEYQKQYKAKHKVGDPQHTANLNKDQDRRQTQLDAEVRGDALKQEDIITAIRAGQTKREFDFGVTLKAYAEELNKLEADLIGKVGESAGAAFQRGTEAWKKQIGANPAMDATLKALIAQRDADKPRVIANAQNDEDIRKQAKETAELTRQEAELNKRYVENTISIGDYARQVLALRDAHRANYQAEIASLTVKAATTAPGAAKDAILEQIATLQDKLAGLKTHAQDVRDMFSSWVTALSGLGSAFHAFDAWSDTLGRIGDYFTKAIAQAQQFAQVIKELHAAMVAMGIVQAATTAKTAAPIKTITGEGLGTGSLLANDSGGSSGGSDNAGSASDAAAAEEKLAQSADYATTGLYSMGGTAANAATGLADTTKAFAAMGGGAAGGAADAAKAAGGVTKAIGYMGVAGMAAGVVIGIASAMFAAAVKKHKDEFEKSMKAITDAFQVGTIGVGTEMAKLQEMRAREVKDLSTSKAGRKALAEELPKIDQAIAGAADTIGKASEAFAARLKASAVLGTGAFVDFDKMLEGLAKDSTDYLKNFDKGTPAYEAAVKDLDQLFINTIKQAKINLQTELQDANAQAIGDATKLLDLLDQRTAIEDQITDLNSQRQDLVVAGQQIIKDEDKAAEDLAAARLDLEDKRKTLAEDAAQLVEDQGKAAKDAAKERADNAAEILDTEKQIKQVILDAQNAEEDVRRKGVLEAQSTIAEQKARDISAIRLKATDDLTTLQKKLLDLQDPTAYLEKVKETNKAFEKRTDELAKQQIALDKQSADLEAQIPITAEGFVKRTDEMHKQERALDKQSASLVQQQKLNEIAIDNTSRIVDMEGTIFSLSRDRYALAAAAGQIEVNQTALKIANWGQVKKLIDSIDEQGTAKNMFTVPPGFPQIHVVIGDIIIDNSLAYPGTIVEVPKDPPSDPTPPKGGGGGDDGRGDGPVV